LSRRVALRRPGLGFDVWRPVPVAALLGVSELVRVEELGRKRVTAAVALAAVAVHSHSHGNTTGSMRGPRTWPPAQVTVAASSRRNSGMRASHSSSATRI